MRVIICGGRKYFLSEAEVDCLDQIHAKYVITEVIEGGADGVDFCAQEWAKDRGIDVTTFHANWTRDGKVAGPIRNKHMLEYLLQGTEDYEANFDKLSHIAVIAFPGNVGTADCIAQAERAGVTIFRYKPPTPLQSRQK
jgi:predicted Rossmann-fold nucleotide-binding protein